MKEFVNLYFTRFYGVEIIKDYGDIKIYKAYRNDSNEDSLILINNNIVEPIYSINHFCITNKKIKRLKNDIFIKIIGEDYDEYTDNFIIRYDTKNNKIVNYKGTNYLTKFVEKMYFDNLVWLCS